MNFGRIVMEWLCKRINLTVILGIHWFPQLITSQLIQLFLCAVQTSTSHTKFRIL